MTGRRAPIMLAALSLLVAATGCDSTASSPSTVIPTASAVRAERRLYDGAPPVIPHPPLHIRCVSCHTETGKDSPPLGVAPANPHSATTGLSNTGDCRQCHVFRELDRVFVDSDFVGLRPSIARDERLYSGAPPVIPHRVFMRENCRSCHCGPGVRPEIRCSHPQRTNCRQCHVQIATATEQPQLETATRETTSDPFSSGLVVAQPP